MRRNGSRRTAEVLEVRAELRLLRSVHGGYVTDAQVAGLFAVVGDAGVCADALSIWPRPMWVEKLVGPYPANLELSNPEDVAGIEEWGAGGTGT
jgi:hypothetical protein